ncbi:SemiSWEET transporter [Candidatus Woesearchaeota archaeon]|jgi:MtN3 and saliva related transmembrane protein|nr:SemiSWEET transporter [Candidatus Woesearchaeota archaeon]
MDYIIFLGFAAGICTTGAFVPQVVKVLKTKSTEDLSLIMYVVMTLGILLWLIYGLLIKSSPVIIANVITLVLSMVVLVMKLKYK